MPLLTAKQLAAELRMNECVIYGMAAAGEIPSYKFGKSRRFDLREVLAARRDQPVPRERVIGVVRPAKPIRRVP